MSEFNVVIPCPHCRSLVQWKVRAQSDRAAGSCVVCEREFSPSYKEAVASFIGETHLRRNLRPKSKPLTS